MKSVTHTALCLAVLAGTTATSAQIGEFQPEARTADSVVPVANEQGLVAVWRGPAEDGELRPAHPPLHLIPPMPMPETDLDAPEGIDAGVALMHNAATGKITTFDAFPESGFGFGEGVDFSSGLGESDESDLYGVLSEGLGSMSQINNVGDDPWRRNVKIVMRFVDQTGANRFFVCSGTMADAETVLTAGHCVYARTATGPDIFDWAEEFWVYPGWDGNGITADQARIIETHGIGYGTVAGAFTGWTQNGNFDWDAGLIRVNRAVGMLTGWYGWAWGGSCGFAQGEFYNNPGYPAEFCSGSLHNGRDMYNWNGTIDDCPGNQLEIDTNPGCFSAMWGGQSGSGLYYFNDAGDRLVHGVASNSNRTTIGRYAKLWESFVTFMQDFENDSRGSSLDLQVLRSRYVQSSITAGNTITGNRYFVTNPTNANPASTTWSITHRLSSNALISTGDTTIGSETYSYDYAAMSSADVNNTGINYTIPLNTPSGTYYVGALLATGNGDTNSSNNDASYWDAHELTVNGVADISANSASPSKTTMLRGETINLLINYSNLGGDSSNTIVADYRLSTNNFISTGDIALGTTSYSGQSGDSSNSRNRSITIPNVTPGTYWLGVILTASDDVNAGNNWVATVPVTITARFCADQNGDGRISPSDYNAWILNFNNGDPRADTNGDGIVTPADYNGWILAYNQGASGPFCTP